MRLAASLEVAARGNGLRGFAGMTNLDVWYAHADMDQVPGAVHIPADCAAAQGGGQGPGQGADQGLYGALCGWTLARAHACSGDRIAIAAYLGGSDVFDRAIADFAAAYADQNERDHQSLVDAAASGRVTAERDV